MKTIISLLLVSVSIISCTESVPYESDVVEHVRRNTKNPNSFKLDSVVHDSYNLSEELYDDYQSDSLIIHGYKDSDGWIGLEKFVLGDDIFITYGFGTTELESKSIYDSLVNRNPKDLEHYKQILKSSSDTILEHEYKVYFMAQNSFGATERHYVRVFVRPNKKPYKNGEVMIIKEEKL